MKKFFFQSYVKISFFKENWVKVKMQEFNHQLFFCFLGNNISSLRK